jgi:uncharacterized protein YndB with AHSA1/START domain
MSTKTEETFSLRLEKRIRAPRARVYAAWTEGEQLKKWSAPDGLIIVEGELDLRVGGRWRVVMQDPASGRKYIAAGIYREVTPPSRLVYTHGWLTDEGGPHDTLLTVEFHDDGDTTLVVLTQEGLPSAGSRDGHTEGWSSALDNLAALFGEPKSPTDKGKGDA